MRRGQIVAYPVLFSVSPLLSLYSEDFLYTHLKDTLRVGFLMVFGTLLIQHVARLYTGDRHRAGVAALFAVVLLSTFGRAWLIINLRASHSPGLLAYAGLLVVWVAVAAGAAARAKTTRWRLDRAAPGLNLISAAMVLAGVLRLAGQEVQITRPWTSASWEGVNLSGQLSATVSAPDIYYIVLDSYPGHEVLLDTFGYDNRALRDYLHQKGFYIAERSRSNYSQTALSLASSMNMAYLGELANKMGRDSSDRTPLARLVRHSEVRSLLEEFGYHTISLESGYRVTEIPDAWHFSGPQGGYMTRFERNAILTSGLRVPLDLLPALRSSVAELSFRGHRERVLHALNQVGYEPESAEPVFAFLHIVCPHPPFVFDETGAPVTPSYLYTLAEGSHYPGPRDRYIESYRKQIAYLDSLLVSAIERILQRSADPPIIIIQSDHGSGYGLIWHSIEESDRVERPSILNAYLMPRASDRLYDTISPVNTFRLLLDSYFGAELPLLPDNSYMSTWERPYDLVQVGPGGSILEPG